MLLKKKNTHSNISTPSPFHPHQRARQTEKERDREEERKERLSHMLLYFISPDFEMRLEETKVNEEK